MVNLKVVSKTRRQRICFTSPAGAYHAPLETLTNAAACQCLAKAAEAVSETRGNQLQGYDG